MLHPPHHILSALRNRVPVVLVTGAGSGIGLALARRLRDSSYRVLATARGSSLEQLSKQDLEETERFLLRPLDVTSATQRQAVIQEAEERWGGVDILINNAGIAYRAVVEDMSDADEELQQATNYLGPLALCRLVLPSMRRRRWGRILNVSSVGGMMAMPTMASYSASKFALEGASESLWYEMKPWKVRVTLVRPGFVRSDSFQKVYRPKNADDDGPYGAYYRNMSRFIEKLMLRALASPDDVAAKILATAARRRPPLRVSATPDARLFYLIRRLVPRRLYHQLLYHSLPGVHRWVPADSEDHASSSGKS